jgi:zinc transporter ZupT
MNQAAGQAQGRSTVLTAIFAWILPGLGHWWIGQRVRAIIFFAVTTITFWGGVAVGGLRSTVSSNENGAWVAAQLCMGPQALGALWLSNQYRSRNDELRFRAPWPASNISVVYAGVAGMLNLLIIIDALSRSELAARPMTAGERERKRE